MPDSNTTIPYLKSDPLYKKDKPFNTSFHVENVTEEQSSNQMFEYKPAVIHDVCGHERNVDPDTHGLFMEHSIFLTSAKASIADTKNNTSTRSRRVYTGHFLNIHALSVWIHRVDKQIDFDQSAALPHWDFSTGGAVILTTEAFLGQDQHWKGQDFDLLKYIRAIRKRRTLVQMFGSYDTTPA
ncbi:hypothetical protein F4803DRAFT_555585 [Xylaria telfairii]|nr:hypothetical protein F4803DRAFT_555585 [Xylaria telfairii]